MEVAARTSLVDSLELNTSRALEASLRLFDCASVASIVQEQLLPGEAELTVVDAT